MRYQVSWDKSSALSRREQEGLPEKLTRYSPMNGKMRSLSIQGNSRRRSESGTPISFNDTALITTGSSQGVSLAPYKVHFNGFSKGWAYR